MERYKQIKMIPQRKCKTCKIELDVLECNSIPTGGFTTDDGACWGGVDVYCKECYKKKIMEREQNNL